ncbi:hypothetical protein, partial [Methanohalobium sp.]|uniref:hypothetical protein n=1 Tax=Methanohalobium sp. TaxID=2837493 RepID=UPI0025D03F8F
MEITKVFKLFGIMSFVCILALSIVSLASAQTDVCRDLPDTASPGDTITVNLDITLDGANKTVIEDNVPEGWTV